MITEISNEQTLGFGAYGKVLVSELKVAEKYLQAKTPREEEIFTQEWSILRKLAHPNIVRYFEHKKTKHGLLVIKMEFCERGSLRQVLFDAKVIYKLPTVYLWIGHLFGALRYLKEWDPSVIHRDLKPENVFVTINFSLKLGDFGCAREKSTQNGSAHVGTVRYMSPEVASGKGVSCKSDVYSAGLILWEIVNRSMILTEYSCGSSFREETFQNEFKSGVFKFKPPNCSDDVIKELFLSCVEYEPANRPSSGEVLKKMASRIADTSATDSLPTVDEENKVIKLIAPIDPDLNDSILNLPPTFTTSESSKWSRGVPRCVPSYDD